MRWGERMARCPHCDQPFGGMRYGVRFGTLAVRIIDTVAKHGTDGIGYQELFELLYAERESQRTALKGHIFQINQRLAQTSDLRISGRGGRYHITTKRKKDAA